MKAPHPEVMIGESAMTTPEDKKPPVLSWTKALIFWVSVTILFILGASVFPQISKVFGLALPDPEQTAWRYEGWAALLWALIFGTISFYIGALIARHMKITVSHLLSAVVGGIYAIVFAPLVMLTPLEPSDNFLGKISVAWYLLFPAVGIILGALLPKRFHSGQDPKNSSSNEEQT